MNLIFLKDFPILEVAKFLFFILDGEGGYNQLLKNFFEIKSFVEMCLAKLYINSAALLGQIIA